MLSAKDKPEFLNPYREKIFREVANALNFQLLQDKASRGHLIQHMSQHMKSNVRRSLLGGILGDYFSDNEDVFVRHDQNMLALEFGKAWFTRVIKLDILDENNPPKQPKTIRRAINKALREEFGEEFISEQLSLFGDEESLHIDNKITPLEDLRHGLIGYMVGVTGLIEGFTFVEFDITGRIIKKIYSIDLDSGSESGITDIVPDFDPSQPSTTVKIKPAYTPKRDEEQA